MLKNSEEEKKRKFKTQTITVEQFLDDPSIEPTIRYNRKLSLGRFCGSLGKEVVSPNPVPNRRYKNIVDREKVVRASNGKL